MFFIDFLNITSISYKMNIEMQEIMNLKLVKEVEKYPCLYKSDMVEYCRRSITDKAWEEVGRVVGWPGQKCKEKFKNIRSVVGRYIKLKKAGIKKRPYYLMEHMRYTFPYIKTFNQNPLDKKAQFQPQPDRYDNTFIYEEIDQEDEFQGDVKVESCVSPYRSPNILYEDASNIEKCESHLASPLSEAVTIQNPTRRLTHCVDMQTTPAGFNQSEQRVDLVDTPTLSTDLPNELQNDPKKMFLLSLLPDVYAMDDKQTRRFKRGVLQLVDDILCDT